MLVKLFYRIASRQCHRWIDVTFRQT